MTTPPKHPEYGSKAWIEAKSLRDAVALKKAWDWQGRPK